MVKKVLPPLNDQNQVPNIAGSGEWKAEDATFLSKCYTWNNGNFFQKLKPNDQIAFFFNFNLLFEIFLRNSVPKNVYIDGTSINFKFNIVKKVMF